MCAAVFFDRDGVVNELVPDPVSGMPESPLAPEQVVLLPRAADALARIRDAGYVLVGVSNQPAAAKGVVTLEALAAVQARVLELLAEAGVVPDDFRICFHHLDDGCACRKPAPGMLIAAAAELGLELTSSWMIGDTDADTAAGAAAGCRTILVETPGSVHKRTGSPQPHARTADLAAAANLIREGHA